MKASYKRAIKRTLLTITAALALVVGTFCYFYVPNPLKITDPYHPWFKPDKFRFEDYPSDCMEKEVLAKLFPVGTDKKFVDRVLVASAGANSYPSEHHPEKVNYFHEHRAWYIWFFPATTNAAIIYDEQDKVAQIKLSGDSVYDFYQDCKFSKQYGYGGAWK